MANFTGTNADEIIIPSFVSSTVTASGGQRPSNAADFIDGGAGNDTIDGGGGNDTINGGDGNDLLIGDAGNDTVTGGRGNDVAILGSGNDRFIWNPGDGSDIVEGGTGTDVLEFNGSNASEHIDISANGSRATLFRDVGAVTMDLDGVEKIALKALGGADVITVNDLTGTDVKQIAVDLAAAGGTGDGLADTVIVNGTADDNHISVVSSGASVIVNGLAAKVTIDGAEPGNDSLVINGLDGNDTINAAALLGGQINLMIDGGAGNDTIVGSMGSDILLGGAGNDVVTGSLGNDMVFLGEGDDRFISNAGDGSVIVEGGAGLDTVQFNGTGGNDLINVSANGSRVALLRGGVFTTDVNGVENIVISAGSGDDVITAGNGLAALTSLTIDGGAGNDTITGGDGADLLTGGNGDDIVTGGRGNDVAFLGNGNDVFVWNPGDGSDIVEGQGGTDTLAFNGSNASERISISANGSRATLFRDVGAVTMDINGVEKIALKALGGADVVTVNDLTGTDVKQIAVDLAAAGGTGDGLADTVIVNGTADDNHISVVSSGTSVVVNGLAAKVTIDGAEAANDFLAVNGLGGNDTINASALNAGQIKLFVDGGAGDDTIRGSNGGDILLGGDGNDRLTGGTGDDHISGNAGDDVILGGGGNDVIDGGDGNDIIKTGDGVDFLQGGSGDDNIQSGGGNDTIEAGDGNDIVVGGAGNDVVSLGGGDDLFTWNAGDGSDVVDGGAGVDTLAFNGSSADESIAIAANGTHVSLTRDVGAVTMDISGIENIFVNTGDGDDTIIAGNGLAALTSLTIDAGAGNDTVIGGDGNDLIFGGAGNDIVAGGRGNDTAFLGSGNDRFTWNPGDGSDTVEGESGFDTLAFNGSNANEHIDIAANGDRVRLFRDVGAVTMDLHGVERIELAALGGADTITVNDLNGTSVKQVAINLAAAGGAGDGQADTVIVNGTAGDNHIGVVSSGTSVVVNGLAAKVTIDGAEAANDFLAINGLDGNDTINASGLNPGQIRLVLSGGAGNDTITASNGGDTLLGGDGNDRLTGGTGDDHISGNSGDDIILGGGGNDVIDGGDGNDIIKTGDGVDFLQGGAGDDTIESGGGNDTIEGGDGNDVITGGAGNDQLFGGGGNDRFVWNPGDGSDLVEGGDGTDTLAFNGSGASEIITVSANGQRVLLTRDVGAVTMDINGVESIVITAGDGDDVIVAGNGLAALTSLTIDGGAGNDSITGGDGADMLIGGAGNDVVAGGRGNDVALLGSGDDRFVWNPGDGSDAVDGQSGFDTLQFNGSNVGEHIDISANGDHARLFRDVGNVTMDLHSIERVNVAVTGGSDTITVNDLTGTGVKHVALDLAATGDAGDGQADTVIVNGTAGGDHISIASNGASVVVNGLSAQVTIDGAEAGNDLLVIHGLGGNDTIDASGLGAGHINLQIDGGTGDDIIIGSGGNDTIIGGTGNDFLRGGAGDDTFVWNPGDGSDTLEGQTGTDTLAFNGANINENVSISANGNHAEFFRDVANITMDTHGVETIDFNALGGADTVTVNDMTGTDVKQINIDLAASIGGSAGDGANDTVVINGTNGSDVITLAIENGALVVSGLASKVVIEHFDFNDTIRIAGLGGDDVIEASGVGADGPKLILDGGDGADVLIGSAGNDTLLGGAGDDVLLGGPGQDVLDGGPGNNILIQSIVGVPAPSLAQIHSDFHVV